MNSVWEIAADLIDPPVADKDPEREKWAADPVGWIRYRLGEEVWSKQIEIIEAVRDNRYVAVHACYNVSKSWTAARLAAWWIETNAPGDAVVVTTARGWKQVRAILWKEINRAHAKGGLSGRTNQTEWWLDPGNGREEIVAMGIKPEDNDPTAFQGVHAKRVLLIIDEAAGVVGPLWDAAESLVSNESSRLLAIGNPDDSASRFAQVCRPGSGYRVVHISYEHSPNFTGEAVSPELSMSLLSTTWVEEKREKWGEDNPLFQARVLGEFPESDTDGLVPLAWVRAAQERQLEPGLPIELGVDVGAGGNRTVVAVRRGSVLRLVRRDTNPDTMVSCGNVLMDAAAVGAETVKVDEYGIGQGLVDRAAEVVSEKGSKFAVKGVKVGVAARDPERFANLRAEGFWALRERFQDGLIDIDPEDEDLAAQLVSIRYKPTSAGRIQVESKKEMSLRGMPSPDDADAAMLAFLQLPKAKRKLRYVGGGKVIKVVSR